MRTLVTGAAGSIGSALARRLAERGDDVVLVDRAEGPLYEIARELGLPEHLADVTSLRAMHRVMAEVRPDLVLHAAAYKHVPMMERHPADAVLVNVGGTLAVVDAALSTRVPRLVLVSTDKAVCPSSVMGATKRLAERICAQAGYAAVRFGNVLDTAGSVLPLWRSQVAAGQPVTVTDPAMTRYFITIGTAVDFVLEAADIASPGDVCILDMGEPVSILDLARATAPPGWPIRVTGPRPGEKVHERLWEDDEALRPTSSPRISAVAVRSGPHDWDELVDIARTGDQEAARSALWAALGAREAAA